MAQDISDLSVTWNDAGVSFNAIKINVTNTASAGGSRVLNLQVGGSTIESTDISGNKVLGGNVRVAAGSAASPAYTFGTDSDTGFYSSGINAASFSTGGAQKVIFDSQGLQIKGTTGELNFPDISNGKLVANVNSLQVRFGATVCAEFSSGITKADTFQVGRSSNDTFLVRDAANTLAQRNGTAAQTFRLYNTFTDASNYERGFMRWSSNVLEFGAEAAGTGTTRAVDLRSGLTRMRLFSSELYSVTAGDISLGKLANPFKDLFLRPSASLTPSANGDLCIEATNNTTLTFKLRGSDGTVRSGTVTLA